jgi:hypothetical protein
MSDILKQLIAAKKRSDPAGFRQAESRGELLSYLKEDLKRARIDPSVLSSHLGNQAGTFDEYVDIASFHVDEVLFEPYYENNIKSNNLGLADVMTKFRVSQSRPLKNIKVAAALSSALCLGFAVISTVRGRPVYSLLYGLCFSDLLRISYHCYDKKYCSLYLESIGGSAANLADSIFKFAKSAMGITPSTEDPLVRFQSEVLWENLVQGSTTVMLVGKVGFAVYLSFCLVARLTAVLLPYCLAELPSYSLIELLPYCFTVLLPD